MGQNVIIRVHEVVGSGLCVASDDGLKVHDQIAAALREGRKAELSFKDVEGLTSAFLNAAVGQLYSEFSNEEIKFGLSVSDMEQEDLELLKRVVETAKEYFKDPDRYSRASREVLGETDDE